MADTFFTTIALPNHPCKILIPESASWQITALNLDQNETYPKEGRTTLYVSVDNSEPTALVPFTIGSFESASVNLQFFEDDHLIFTVKGTPIPVHISGTLCGAMSLDVDNGVPPVEETIVVEEEETVITTA